MSTHGHNLQSCSSSSSVLVEHMVIPRLVHTGNKLHTCNSTAVDYFLKRLTDRLAGSATKLSTSVDNFVNNYG